MKFLFLLIALPFSSALGAQPTPQDGFYTCVQGNNNSICEQKIKTILVNGKLDSIRVMYEGYCNGQGPYTYACEENICTDWAIQITLQTPTRYYWENLGHGIHCQMEKLP